jgi:predicted hydrolase (HD superfamily)
MSEIKDVGAAYDKQFERVSDTETVLREFYDKAYAAGVAKERERCAKVSEEYPGALHTRQEELMAYDIAAAIRG